MKLLLGLGLLGLSTLVAMAPLQDKQPPSQPTASDGFKALQAALEKPDANFDKLLVRDMVTRRAGVDDVEWQKQFTAELVKVKFLKAREAANQAVARYVLDGEEKDLPMKYAVDTWIPAAPQGYVVKGKSLDLRRGKKALHVVLKARTKETDGYGESSYSFVHVTGDPAVHKNRADLWYCHNGDLHLPMSNRATIVEQANLQKVEELPLAEWKVESFPAVEDTTYVLHCTKQGIRDFYVKLRVTAKTDKKVEFDWTLLSDGFGAPADLKEAHPLEASVAASGADGLCGKKSK
jgi:hypothetical protein